MGIKPLTFRTPSGCSYRSEIITPFSVWGVVLLKSRRIVIQKITDITPYRTFLVRVGGISGEFGRVVVHINTQTGPNESNMPPKRTKNVRLVTNRTQIRPSDHDIVPAT